MNSSNNQRAWCKRAAAVLPAGGFGNFDHSIVIRNGLGSRDWDEDGTEYVPLDALLQQAEQRGA